MTDAKKYAAVKLRTARDLAEVNRLERDLRKEEAAERKKQEKKPPR